VRPHVKQYIDDTIKKAHDDGFVETLFGRRRWTPDVKSSNFVVRQAAERAAANMPIQGTEADLMKLAMIEVDKRLDGRGEQLLQIHDSILIECPKDNAEAISDMLVDTMENIYSNLGVRLQVDVHTGDNWGEV
jgi:DNA polymerase-1